MYAVEQINVMLLREEMEVPDLEEAGGEVEMTLKDKLIEVCRGKIDSLESTLTSV